MGRIVGAFGTSHVLMAPDGVEAQAERVFDGMKEIGRRVRALRPDVLVIMSSDHLINFKVELQIPFVVGACETYVPYGEMEIPRRAFAGHRGFAEDLLRESARFGFDLARAEELRPDHGMAIPNAIVNPAGSIPVVPLYINTAISAPPTPARAWALGTMLKAVIESVRPAAERVVVLAAGGLSHWICTPGHGQVNVAFDREILDTLCAGRGSALADLSVNDILEQAGNGGLEIVSWICMAAAVPGRTGETIYYEPMPEWLTGMGGIAMHMEAAE